MPSFLLLSAVEILLDQFQHLLRTVLYLCTQGSILVRTQFGNNPINHCRTEHMILLKDSTLSFQTIGRSGTTIRKLFQLFQLIFISFLWIFTLTYVFLQFLKHRLSQIHNGKLQQVRQSIDTNRPNRQANAFPPSVSV